MNDQQIRDQREKVSADTGKNRIYLHVREFDVQKAFPLWFQYLLIQKARLDRSLPKKVKDDLALWFCVMVLVLHLMPGPNAVMDDVVKRIGVFPAPPQEFDVSVTMPVTTEVKANTTNSPTPFFTGEAAKTPQIDADVAGYNINYDFDYRGKLDGCPGCGPFHSGLDIGTPMRTPIYAMGLPGSKVYVEDGSNEAGGKIAVMYSPSIPGQIFLAVHLDEFTPGEYNPGEVIGYTGNTGRNTTGPHLHFEQHVMTAIYDQDIRKVTDIAVTDPALNELVKLAREIAGQHGAMDNIEVRGSRAERAEERGIADYSGIKEGQLAGFTRIPPQAGMATWILTGNAPANPADAAVMVTPDGLPQPEQIPLEQIEKGFYGGPLDSSKQPIIVLHETVVDAQGAIRGMSKGTSREPHSYHAIIDRTGKVFYLVPFDLVAYGAGVSKFNGEHGSTSSGQPTVNLFAYQISFESDTNCGPDKPGDYENCSYTQEQYRALAHLIRSKLSHVPLDRITTHKDVEFDPPGDGKDRWDPRGFDMARFLTMLSATQPQDVK